MPERESLTRQSTPGSVRALAKQVRLGLVQGHPRGEIEAVLSRLETEIESRFESLSRRQEQADRWADGMAGELDATYASIRALAAGSVSMVGNAMKHALVGLLPETREMDPETATKMREKGLGALVDRHDALVKDNWREWGYGDV